MVWTGLSFNDFLRNVEKKNIICYGAGMLPLYLEPLFSEYHILERINCFLDGNPEKGGTEMLLGGKRIPVRKWDAFQEWDPKENSLLITAERYPEILKRLEQLECFQAWDCYVWPLLNLSCFKENWNRSGSVADVGLHNLKTAGSRIPKVIHYTWFGKGEKTFLMEQCIESWRVHCPEFRIQEWNEDHYDISKNLYVKQAYETGKWAYVSDFARLDILYRHGGIYLDTDVELFQSIGNICAGDGFICAGEWPVPNSGAGVGCVPGHPMIKEMMRAREERPFLDKRGKNDCRTNSNYEMEVLLEHGFSMDFSLQQQGNFFFYPPDVIAPASITGEDAYVTERTIGKHYCGNSWREKTCYG